MRSSSSREGQGYPPLEVVNIRSHKHLEELLLLEDFPRLDIEELCDLNAGSGLAVAAQSWVQMPDARTQDEVHRRIVGIMWGDQLEVKQGKIYEKIPKVFEIHDVITDITIAYRRWIEKWLLRQLKKRALNEKWDTLAICTGIEDTEDRIVDFAKRFGFTVRDVMNGEYIWDLPLR